MLGWDLPKDERVEGGAVRLWAKAGSPESYHLICKSSRLSKAAAALTLASDYLHRLEPI